jgi:hypothetical protein
MKTIDNTCNLSILIIGPIYWESNKKIPTKNVTILLIEAAMEAFPEVSTILSTWVNLERI